MVCQHLSHEPILLHGRRPIDFTTPFRRRGMLQDEQDVIWSASFSAPQAWQVLDSWDLVGLWARQKPKTKAEGRCAARVRPR